MAKNDDKRIRCSFCGKHQDQVKRMIAGPGVYICDECVNLCVVAMGADPLLMDELDQFPGDIPDVIPKGKCIRAILKKIYCCVKVLNIGPCPKCHGWDYLVWASIVNATTTKMAKDFAVILRQ